MEPEGLGISWLWKLPNTHPFYQAGIKHDRAYDLMLNSTSIEADKEFLKDCLAVSNTLILKLQAYLFYTLCRIWGIYNWNGN